MAQPDVVSQQRDATSYLPSGTQETTIDQLNEGMRMHRILVIITAYGISHTLRVYLQPAMHTGTDHGGLNGGQKA